MMDDDVRAMAAFYDSVDREIAELADRLGLECRGCGECCHFESAGHILYASMLEKRYLAHTSPPISRNATIELMEKGWRCPFQEGNCCLARNGRVLGCRLHYCDAKWGEEGEELAELWHRRLKELHNILGREWDYSPLLPFQYTIKV